MAGVATPVLKASSASRASAPRECWRASRMDAARLGARPAFAGAGADGLRSIRAGRRDGRHQAPCGVVVSAHVSPRAESGSSHRHCIEEFKRSRVDRADRSRRVTSNVSPAPGARTPSPARAGQSWLRSPLRNTRTRLRPPSTPQLGRRASGGPRLRAHIHNSPWAIIAKRDPL